MKNSVPLNFQSNLKNLKLKILLFFLFSVLYSLFSIQGVFAQSYNNPATVQQNQYASPNTNPDVPKNLHTYSQNVLLEVMAAVSCQLTGIDPVNPKQKCLGVDQKTGKIGFVENGGGAVGVMGNLIAMTFTPPIHTIDYFQNLSQNFGITKPTYAFILGPDGKNVPTHPSSSSNGIGLQGISPLLDIWAAFRNIVYLLFVLVFVIIGVAIMLRVKIDPRTVMTIQNQIPKLIIGILLVTFSFAIAGFLIDVMWITIYLFYGVFNSIPGPPIVDVTSLNPQNMVGATPIGAVGFFGDGGIGGIALNGAGAINNVISSLFDNKWGRIIAASIGGALGLGAGGALGTVAKLFRSASASTSGLDPISLAIDAASIGVGITAGILAGSKLLGIVGGIIAFLIIAIALLWALIRLWFTLLMAYIMILIGVVLAPFWIIAGLFPGSTISFSAWARDLVANLAAFPATIVMFLLGKTFIDAFATSPGQGQFVPPLIGNPGDIKSFGALIGLGIILTTPNVVNMMKAALKAPKFDLSAAGQAIGVGAGYPISVGRGVGQTMVGRNEIIMRRNQAGQTEWGERGVGRAFFGRFFGRG